ncbi:MAG: hypothetical protein JWM16_6039 [Verrucomicrobiales bacterium]|nr:hypothetical protein [Verrucomicrobiales bacterium]
MGKVRDDTADNWAKILTMRCHVELDKALERRLREHASAKGISFTEAINRTLKLGLQVLENTRLKPDYRIKARNCGLQPEIDYTKLGTLIDQFEAEDYTRKQR